MLKNRILFACLLAMPSLFAQENYMHRNSADSIRAGIDYFEKGEFEKALTQFTLVHPGDSNYSTARYEEILTYSAMDNFDTSITLLNEFLKTPYSGHNASYAELGRAHDALGQHEKAIQIFKEGLAKYPMDGNLHYKIAVVYQNSDSLDLAVQHYKNALKANPFDASSNLNLGFICAEENELAMAMMCFDLFLLIEPSSSRSLDVLSEYNEMVKENFQGESKNVKLKDNGEDNFDDINLIIRNRVALQDKYKTPNKLTLPIVKQNHALFESLKGRSGSGFWFEYYVPFLNEVYKQEKFNDFMYYILLSSTSDFIIKVLEKNSKKINEFPGWAGNTWIDLHTGYTELVDGKKHFIYYLLDNGKMYAKGRAEESEKIADWTYYHGNGSRSAEGSYSSNKKNGEWKYYYNSLEISGLEEYNMDTVIGEDISYFKDGSIWTINSYKNGLLEGPAKSFNENGSLSSSANYVNNELEGQAEYYYENGSLNYSVQYKKGELDGEFKEFYPSGELKSASFIKDGKRVGKFLNYYRNGNVSSEAEYIDGKKEGAFSNYYYDAALKEEGQYHADKIYGTYKEYYPNGTLESEGHYDENGNENGIFKQYEQNGKLNLTLTFKKGELTAYSNYNEKGDEILSEKKSGGRFYYQNLFFNGNKRAEGNYEVGDGGKHGLWRFYRSNGSMYLEEPYNYGVLNGELKEYYSNGVLSYLINYTQGERNGKYISFNKDASLERIGWYSDDEKNDDWYVYYPNGILSQHLFYVKGKFNGPQRYYDINGNLEHVDYYNNGLFDHYLSYDTLGNEILALKITKDESEYTLVDIQEKKARTFKLKHLIYDGESEYFYSNGDLEAKGSFFNGSKNGDWVYYYRNGNISSEGSYYDGERTGTWTTYFENGSIKSIIEYDYFGQYHGKYMMYHDNGQLSYATEYNKGYNSIAYYYSPDGDLQHARYFEDGVIIGYSHEGPTGQLLSMIPVKNESAEVVSTYSNGTISKEFTWENGMMVGAYKEYYKDGTLFEKMDFVDGDYNGYKERYYKNGKIKMRIPYLRDYKHGKEKHYAENGVLLKEISYHYDDKHGYSKYYDSSGKLMKTEYYYENTLILNE